MGDEWQPKPPEISTTPGVFRYPTDPRTGVPTAQLTRIMSDADALKNHLMWGEATLSYVRRYMTIGASNKPVDLLASFGESYFCVDKLKSDYASGPSFKNWHDAVAECARLGRARGCGNCGEQSAIAYMFLWNNGMLPVDWIKVNGVDHNFTLLGCRRGAGSDKTRWGSRCVVVDPWNGTCYPGAEIGRNRDKGETYTSLVQE